MNPKLREFYEKSGYGVFDGVADFLGLSEDEQRMVELRLALSGAIRKTREKLKLTRDEAAAMLKMRPSRYATVELGSRGASLDLMIRSLFQLGGDLPYGLGRRRLAERSSGKSVTERKSSKSTRVTD